MHMHSPKVGVMDRALCHLLQRECSRCFQIDHQAVPKCLSFVPCEKQRDNSVCTVTCGDESSQVLLGPPGPQEYRRRLRRCTAAPVRQPRAHSWLLLVDCWLLVVDCWRLAAGCLDVGCLVVGCCLLAVDMFQKQFK